jgi:hypothetical protein
MLCRIHLVEKGFVEVETPTLFRCASSCAHMFSQSTYLFPIGPLRKAPVSLLSPPASQVTICSTSIRLRLAHEAAEGRFYALPQSPQQYKQLLMSGCVFPSAFTRTADELLLAAWISIFRLQGATVTKTCEVHPQRVCFTYVCAFAPLFIRVLVQVLSLFVADRQPEFTQLDLEVAMSITTPVLTSPQMSFITPEHIYSLLEGLMSRIWKQALNVRLH